MGKPWDKLRNPERKPPIESGYWSTAGCARVGVTVKGPIANIDTHNYQFGAISLRELAEFCTELADQLDGK